MINIIFFPVYAGQIQLQFRNNKLQIYQSTKQLKQTKLNIQKHYQPNLFSIFYFFTPTPRKRAFNRKSRATPGCYVTCDWQLTEMFDIWQILFFYTKISFSSQAYSPEGVQIHNCRGPGQYECCTGRLIYHSIYSWYYTVTDAQKFIFTACFILILICIMCCKLFLYMLCC